MNPFLILKAAVFQLNEARLMDSISTADCFRVTQFIESVGDKANQRLRFYTHAIAIAMSIPIRHVHELPTCSTPPRSNHDPEEIYHTPLSPILTRQIPISLRATCDTMTLASLRLILLFFIFTHSFLFASSSAAFKPTRAIRPDLSRFREAPAFRNGVECSTVSWPAADRHAYHHPAVIHIAMTLDTFYLRGSVAAVLSVLQHASCPENIVFHFLASSARLRRTITSTFPYLNFHLYHFDAALVTGKISSSIRRALDQPLNYARMYLADLLPATVRRVIYLDSDLVVVDDAAKLWAIDLGPHVLGAPEYCHANFTNYFTHKFWADPALSKAFEGRRPCYFNTGVMVIDLERWREGKCREKLEGWMRIQKRVRIYELGSLPPFLLVFAGDVRGVGHRWNQHGLGGDNLEGLCRDLHPGAVSLLHWSGKGKPWLRLDSKRPCPLDALWAPYDLYRHASANALSFSDS